MKLLLLFMLISTISFAQEETTPTAEVTEVTEVKTREQIIAEKQAAKESAQQERATKQAAKKAERQAAKAAKKAAKEAEYNMSVHYDPHTIAISYGLGMGSFFSDNSSLGIQNLKIEFYTRKRKGKTGYTPLVELRFNFPLSGQSQNLLYGTPSWGFLFGGSQYIFDKRDKQTGIGWSMLANGGMTFEFATVSSLNHIGDIGMFPVIIGADLGFKPIYNFNKYVGVMFGFNIGYVASINIPLKDLSNIEFNDPTHGLTFNFNVGLIF